MPTGYGSPRSSPTPDTVSSRASSADWNCGIANTPESKIIPILGLSRCFRVVAGSGLFSWNGCRDNPGLLEGFEERDELIRWLVSSECCRGRGGSVQGFLFEFEIGMEVNAGGVDVFVAEP